MAGFAALVAGGLLAAGLFAGLLIQAIGRSWSMQARELK